MDVVSDVVAARSRAAEFLAGCSDPTARAAVGVREGREAADELFEKLGRAAADASPSGLLAVLRWLDDLGELSGDAAAQVAERAGALQADAGHWGAAADANTVATTGMLAGHLAKSRCARLELLDAAGDWLAARFSPELVQGFQWQNIAAYAHTFANLPHDAADGILQWCGRELERGVRARQFSAVRAARVLVWCDAPVLPGASIEPSELVAAILGEQAGDGGFGDGGFGDSGLGGAPELRAERTWDAWIALERLA